MSPGRRRPSRSQLLFQLALGFGLSVQWPVASLAQDAPGLRLEFCDDDTYPLVADEAKWCPFAADAEQNCPSFAEACRRYAGQDPSELRAPASDVDRDHAAGGGPSERRRLNRKPQFEVSEDAGILGPIAQVGFWLILIVGAGALISFLWPVLRAARRGGSGADELPVNRRPRRIEDLASAAAPTDPLGRARAAAERGDFETAIELACSALLNRLQGRGLIALHPSKTSGDYLRALRRQPQARDVVEPVLVDVDAMRFGARPPSRGLFDRIVDAVGRMASVWVVIALCSAHPGCDSDRYPYETSPSGHALLEELLRGWNIDTYRRTDPLNKLEYPDAFGQPPPTLIVLLDGAVPTDDEWSDLVDWVALGYVLVVAHGGRVETPYAIRTERGEPPLDSSLAQLRSPLEWDAVERGKLLEPSGDVLVLPDDNSEISDYLTRGDGESPFAVVMAHGLGEIIVMANDELFTNVGLSVGDNRDVVQWIFGPNPDCAVHLIDADFWNSPPPPLQRMFEGRLLPLTLQLLALFAAFALWRGVHFGRPRELRTPGRKHLAEHAKALGNHYARRASPSYRLTQFAPWALSTLRAETGLRSADSEALAEAVSARSGASPTEVRADLHAAAQALAGQSVTDAEAVMQRLAHYIDPQEKT